MLPGKLTVLRIIDEIMGRLEQDFNYNAMVSQRGILNLSHSDGQHDAYARRGNAMHLNKSGAVL